MIAIGRQSLSAAIPFARSQRALVAGFLLSAPLGQTVMAQSLDGSFQLGDQALRVETVANGLNRPWGLAFLPNGDLIVTSKNGGLSRLPDGRGPAVPISGLPADLDQRLETPIDNAGLFDVAIDPDFDATRRIFLSYASSASDGGSALTVSSFTLEQDRLADQEVLLIAGPRSLDRFHYGGGLLPLADGTLLITSGERFASENPQGRDPVAQNPTELRGKILRIRFDGSVPTDNPFVGQDEIDEHVYALGIRNAQGIAQASDGSIWFSEHGPRAGDELNRLQRGANYGWPQQTCGVYKDRDYQPPDRQGVQTISPVGCWGEVTYAPAGIAFYDSPAIAAWQGKLLMAGLSAGHLLLLTLSDDAVVEVQSLFERDPQRLRDVAVAPDGSIYLAVDGENGRIVRLSPARGASAAVAGRAGAVWSSCLQCHSTEAEPTDDRMTLANLFGRRAASSSNAVYSDALKESGIVWDAETLDAYLADPDSLVRGTTMPVRVIDPDEREAIIELMRTLQDTRPPVGGRE